jgi:hypothetical protein
MSPEHLSESVRTAIEITPAAGARERTVDITTIAPDRPS